MLTVLSLLFGTADVYARGAEVAIVSAHLSTLGDEQAQSLANALVETIDDLDNLDSVSPGELRARIQGRESLIVEGIFLGSGRQALDEGRVLYDRGELESALPVLEMAVETLRTGLAGSGDSKDLIDALLLLGILQAALGEEDAARDAFGQVVVLEPQRQLDRFNYPPRIVNLFTEVREAALAGPRVSLTIISPDDASLLVDGRAVPRSDRTTTITDLLPGQHNVLVQTEDGRRSFTAVTVADQETVRAELSTRGIAPTAADAEGRSLQTEQLYRSLGEYADTPLILLAGETAPGMLGVQLYEPRTGNFSRMEELAVGGEDSLQALQSGVRRLDAYVVDGSLNVDFVEVKALSMDINSNPLLLSLLLDPEPIVETIIERRTPWYVWAGAGTLAVGGAATAAVLLAPSTVPATTGTVIVNLPE